MSSSVRFALTIALFVLPMAATVFAQGGPPVGGPPPCWPPPCIPIDGGVSILIGAGLLLGGRKALELRKERKLAR